MKSMQKCAMLLILVASVVVSKKISKTLNCTNKKRTNSFLWLLKRDPPAYFFGTIHVPYKKVWSHIPRSSKKAFKRSEKIFFELDLTDPHTMVKLAQCQILPKGSDLRSVLPDDLYRRTKEHLHYVRESMSDWVSLEQKHLGKWVRHNKIRKKILSLTGNPAKPLNFSWFESTKNECVTDLYHLFMNYIAKVTKTNNDIGIHADLLYDTIVGNWERKKPVWVMLMIKSLTKADIRSRGAPVLDFHLARKALTMRKEVGALEEVQEQCHPLNKMNKSQVLFALNQTLMIQENIRKGYLRIPYSTTKLIKQYNCGELDTSVFNQAPELTESNIIQNGETDFGAAAEDLSAMIIDSYLKTELIYKRNKRMAERIKQILNEDPNKSYFFALGAGHFLGNDSIIELFRKKGFEVKNLKAADKLKKIRSQKKKKTTEVRKTVKENRSRRNNRRRRKTKANSRTASVKKSLRYSRSKKKIVSFENKTNANVFFEFFSSNSYAHKGKNQRNTFHQEHFEEYHSGEDIQYKIWLSIRKDASANAMGMYLSLTGKHIKFWFTQVTILFIVKAFAFS